MFRLVYNKIKNKKWLNLCLLIGITLLVAVFVCHPMLENGAGNKILWDGFTNLIDESGEYPAVFLREGSYLSEDFPDAESVQKRLKEYEKKWISYVDVDTVESVLLIKLAGDSAQREYEDSEVQLIPTYMSDLEQHISIKRQMDGEVQKDVFPVLVSEQLMDNYGLIVGEELTYQNYTNSKGEPAKFVISGVFEPIYGKDNYWYHSEDSYQNAFYVPIETIDALVSDYGFCSYQFADYLLLDYTQINSYNAEAYLNYIAQFKKADNLFNCNFYELLCEYDSSRVTVRRVLFVLEIPCMVILLLFLYMVAKKITESEEGEIAVLRSRGVKRGQVILIYVIQSGIICVLAFGIGLVSGIGLCKIAASTDGFLQFASKDTSDYSFTWSMLIYAIAACFIAIFVIMIPVLFKSGITIVAQKSAKNISVIPFWEKSFLDVILLVVSGYLLFDFIRQKDVLAASIMEGRSVDPLILMNASFFILACGLLFLRLFRYIMKFVNYLGGERWSAHTYAALLQILRTYGKQSFLAVFLIMTVAGGIFDAGMARTVNENNEKRLTYELGCDLVLTEKWVAHHTRTKEENITWYEATDVERYRSLVDDGVCDSLTRVFSEQNAAALNGSKSLEKVELMAINTKEFGETANLDKSVAYTAKTKRNNLHWYEALNALAADSEGAIISEDVAKELELSVGDGFYYGRPDVDKEKQIRVNVVAIVDSFPGHNSYFYETDEKGNVKESTRGLIVVNFATIVGDYGTEPYDIWLKLSGDTLQQKKQNTKAVREFFEKEQIETESVVSLSDVIERSRSQSLVQVTNGMFTISFLITLLVCFVGFLLYWTMEIGQRQLQYGIYRSMGMKMREIRSMMIIEQLLSSVIPLLLSGGIGILTIVLFSKLIMVMYLPQKHNIPMMMYIKQMDIIRLFTVLCVMIIICFVILVRQIKSLKIAQALKLGED